MTQEDMGRLVREQIEYYRARASEFDEWFLRQGRYDRGPEVNSRWHAETATVIAALDSFAPAGRVLELACGTGLWTQHLVHHAAGVTAVDASPEMLDINKDRLGRSGKVRHVLADVFEWRPDAEYDVVFFSFWLSHVPPERFVAFWELVRSSLAPGGRVFFVDALYDETSVAVDHRLEGPRALTAKRRLNDGREFEIVKVFYEPDDLARRLADLGWRVAVRRTPTFFLYGWGERS